MPKMKIEIPAVDYFEKLIDCRTFCPVITDAGGYVRDIAECQDYDAYLKASKPNPLVSICGRICAHPCEEACRRSRIDQPISIRALKRFVTEKFGAESPSPMDKVASHSPPRSQKKKGSVAIIGGGPAGLSCAHDLSLNGFQVTIFEASHVAGGMLYMGIPEYRLPRDIIRAEVARILSYGVELKTKWKLGRDFSLKDLLDNKYDAVFVASGASKGRSIDIPGSRLQGVINGIDFLINVNLGYHIELGNQVAVIGGGNVAIDVARSALRQGAKYEDGSTLVDVARSALRLGAREVHLFSLESKEELPAYSYEVDEAENEGIIMHHSKGPKSIYGDNGGVKAVETLDVASVFDHEGRFNPKFIPNSEETFSADTVILAIGQMVDLSAFEKDSELEITKRGTIFVDQETLATSIPGVYAGGDCVFGPRIIIDAIADGRRAAESISRYLLKAEKKAQIFQFQEVPLDRSRDDFDRKTRMPIPTLPTHKRTGFREVELCYDEESARAEANRCLWCHVETIFDSSLCIMCGGCVDACPENCLTIVPLKRIGKDERIESIAKNLNLSSSSEVKLLLKDEDRCIRCALCAKRCPVGAITMEKLNIEVLEGSESAF
jgi:NADPH-dependent glutamate synthase beta subunit-like oxidoreductase/ferredoxin